LEAILREGVINIDETPVNLRKTTGYVWVLATHNKVCYIYKESRKALSQGLASGVFRESLSQIFYCLRFTQMSAPECLVHLMRDINDDLRRHPFDDELATSPEFGVFLANAVSTIDRWGLKARHLHKHIKDSDRFLQQIHGRSFASEQAAKIPETVSEVC